MLVHQRPIDEAFATLRSNPEGLSSAEPADRLAIFSRAAIGIGAWLVMVPFALTMVVAEEARKAAGRLLEQRTGGAARAASAT